jgi:hypothetical protein
VDRRPGQGSAGEGVEDVIVVRRNGVRLQGAKIFDAERR